MNIKSVKIFVLFSFLIFILNACAPGGKSVLKEFKHNTPLIKEDVRKIGKAEIDKTVKMGPTPVEGDFKK